MNEQNAQFGRDIVNELVADIKAYGVNSPCVLIFGRESGKLRDYEFKKEKVAFADETHKASSLFNALVAFVHATSHAAGQPLTPRQSCFLAALKVCEQAPDAMFAAVGKSEQAAQDIIVGRVEPSLNDIAAATTHIGAKINLTDYIY